MLGLNLCQFMKIKSVQMCSDSQLIMGQMAKEFEVKEENMKAYFEKAESLTRSFDNFEIRHIPRSENQQANALARLASLAEGIAPRNIMWEVLEKPNILKKLVKKKQRAGEATHRPHPPQQAPSSAPPHRPREQGHPQSPPQRPHIQSQTGNQLKLETSSTQQSPPPGFASPSSGPAQDHSSSGIARPSPLARWRSTPSPP
uniref:RNase H type-1 domain-containing protein n=1 Tax=Chenopodium quinoa TaxID=63459 RepID=A0A803MZ97_CHEQI